MVVLNIEDAVTEEHGKYEIVELNDLVEITCDACDHKVLLERGTKLKIQEGNNGGYVSKETGPPLTSQFRYTATFSNSTLKFWSPKDCRAWGKSPSRELLFVLR